MREREIASRPQPAETQHGGLASEAVRSVSESLPGRFTAVRAAASTGQVRLLRLSNIHPPHPHGLPEPGWPRPGRPSKRLSGRFSGRQLSWRRRCSTQVFLCLPGRARSEHCYRSCTVTYKQSNAAWDWLLLRSLPFCCRKLHFYEHDFLNRCTFVMFLKYGCDSILHYY